MGKKKGAFLLQNLFYLLYFIGIKKNSSITFRRSLLMEYT